MTTSTPSISFEAKLSPQQKVEAQLRLCKSRQTVWREQVVRSMPNHVKLHEAFDDVFRILNEAVYHDHVEASRVMGITTSDTMVSFHIVATSFFTRTIKLIADYSTSVRVEDGFLNISISSKERF